MRNHSAMSASLSSSVQVTGKNKNKKEQEAINKNSDMQKNTTISNSAVSRPGQANTDLRKLSTPRVTL